MSVSRGQTNKTAFLCLLLTGCSMPLGVKVPILDVRVGDCVSKTIYEGLSDQWRPKFKVLELGEELVVLESLYNQNYLYGKDQVFPKYNLVDHLSAREYQRVDCPKD